jgi:hypothetical protein
MNRKGVLALILAAGLSLCPLAARDSIEEVPGQGLSVLSEPSGVTVYLDGVERGLTPLYLDLPGGEYNVRLHRDGYQERRLKVSLHSTGRLIVSLDMEKARGQVFLILRPGPDAPPAENLDPVIIADGEFVTGPLVSLPVGYRTILVRAFGWKDVSQTVYVEEGKSLYLDIALSPAPMVLDKAAVSRGRFNPRNAGSLGTTEFSFEVSAPGRGWLRIRNSRGETVYSSEERSFTGRVQRISWDGRAADGNFLPDGAYTAHIEAESVSGGPEASRSGVFLPVTLDSSLTLRPLTLSSGNGGLLFAPAPEALPPGEFQIEGLLLFGRPPLTGRTWRTLPFAVAFRVTPLRRLELTAALNVVPEFDAALSLGASGSVKWVIRETDRIPLALAAGLSYGWAEEGSATPFGMGTGAQLFFPLEWRLASLGNSAGNSAFSLLFTPALLWTGDRGYPMEAAPRGLLSGGLLLRQNRISAGISARQEFTFAGTGRGAGPLMLGGEIKLHSAFVFSLLGGAWFKGSALGGFGGIGIGLVY